MRLMPSIMVVRLYMEVKSPESVRLKNGYKVELLDADKNYYSFSTGIVINSAGLTSDKVSELVGIFFL